jgi:hypothetical protein
VRCRGGQQQGSEAYRHDNQAHRLLVEFPDRGICMMNIGAKPMRAWHFRRPQALPL